MCVHRHNMSQSPHEQLIDAIKRGDTTQARRLLESGGADVDALVNEYSELPGLAAFGVMPKVTLLAYVIQSVAYGGADRQAALRMVEVLLNVNRRHGRYAGASLDATFDIYEDDEDSWIDRDHNDYTFKISERTFPVTVEEYVRSLMPKCPEPGLDPILHMILLAKARKAADDLLITTCRHLPTRPGGGGCTPS